MHRSFICKLIERISEFVFLWFRESLNLWIQQNNKWPKLEFVNQVSRRPTLSVLDDAGQLESELRQSGSSGSVVEKDMSLETSIAVLFGSVDCLYGAQQLLHLMSSLQQHSFIHIEHLYSASSRKLLRGAPDSSTTKKSSLKVRRNAGDKADHRKTIMTTTACRLCDVETRTYACIMFHIMLICAHAIRAYFTLRCVLQTMQHKR